MNAFQRHEKRLTEMEREHQEMKKQTRAYWRKLKRKVRKK